MRLLNPVSLKSIAMILIIAIFSSGCAPSTRYRFEDGPGESKIYLTKDGDTLRVDSEGKVYGYPGNKRFGPGEQGIATRVGEEWDMSPFDVELVPPGCKILIPLFYSEKAFKERYVSCWNRAWEIPAVVIVLPFAFVVALAMGLVIGIDMLFEDKPRQSEFNEVRDQALHDNALNTDRDKPFLFLGKAVGVAG